MNILDFIEFVKTAQKQNRKEELFQVWLIQLPHIKKEDYISFEEYYNKQTLANVDKRPANEIINEIIQAHGGDLSGS